MLSDQGLFRSAFHAALVGWALGSAEAFLRILQGSPRSSSDAISLLAWGGLGFGALAALLLVLAWLLPAVRRAANSAAVALPAFGATVIVFGALIRGGAFESVLFWLASLVLAVVIGLGVAKAVERISSKNNLMTWACLNALIFALAAAATLVRFEPKSQAIGQPAPDAANVVLISVDTLRADHLGAYGYARAKTPFLDQLASQGVVFEHAIASAPHTIPSHASMLTGLYPLGHGALENGIVLKPGVWSLPQALAAQGYQTAAFVSGYPLESRLSGFGEHFAYYDDDFRRAHWVPDSLARLLLGRPLVRALEALGIEFGRLSRRASDVTDAALAWLDGRKTKPFFVWIHYWDPHVIYDPPAEYARLHYPEPIEAVDWYALGSQQREALMSQPEGLERFVAQYDGEISYVDAQLGRFLQRLSETASGENTIVIFTADHGESLGDRGVYFEHGDLYDHIVRVPLIVRLPQRLHAGGRIASTVSLTDIAPTVLELLGLHQDSSLEGRSLVAQLEGRDDSQAPIYSFLFNPDGRNALVAVRSDGMKLIWKASRWRGIRRLDDREELYQLSDVTEDHELAAENPPQLEALRELIRPWTAPRAATASGVDDEVKRRLESLGYVQ